MNSNEQHLCQCGHETNLHDDRGCMAWNPPGPGHPDPTRCLCTLTRQDLARNFG